MKTILITVALGAAGAAQADDDIAAITRDNPPSIDDADAWAALPGLMLEAAGAAAEAANRRTVAEVLADEDSTVENGVEVFFVTQPHWCGRVAGLGVFCWDDRRICAQKAKGCRAQANVACVGAQTITDGEVGVYCRPSYGECEQTRRVMLAIGEYTVGDCSVRRRRAGKR